MRTPLLVLALVALALGIWATQRGHGRTTLHGVVVRAVDGDTLVVRLQGGPTERVRLIGVDTPEDVKPGVPVQCYSLRAAAFTRRALAGRRVTLVVGRDARDRYGRLLAYVRADGAPSEIEVPLLEAGYARPLAITPNTDRAVRYAHLAAAAQVAGRGLWGACT
jgi:micrococcal nuclease